MNSAIRTENLTKRFRRVNAISAVTLDVPAGAVYAFVGPNGAGKTTLIKVLMNIFTASSGAARVLDRDTRELRGDLFSSIGYVSENQQLPDWMRVRDFLAYLRPFYPAWDRDLEVALVRQFELPLDRRLRHLSRGMRMKAALAGALAYHPKLIVLDEPFTGLDPLVRDELIQGLLDRAEESTIFISSHDLAEIESFASHVGYIEQGRLQFSEELSSLSARFREVELTFDSPPSVPIDLPPAWMQLNATASVVRFVDSRFDQEHTTAEIRRVFPGARNQTFTPMSLREIFVTMARAARGKREEAQ